MDVRGRARRALGTVRGRLRASLGRGSAGTPGDRRTRQLDGGLWLVSERDGKDRRVRVDDLGQGTWVVRRGRGRTVRQVGPPRIRTHLVVDPAAAHRHFRVYERGVLHHMADEHVAEVLRRLRVDCVIDVGANLGQFGKRLRRHGFTGRIVSFEPLAHLADVLEQAAAGDPGWRVMRYALGREAAETEMEVAGGQGRMSSLRSPSEFGRGWSPKLGSEGSQVVSVRRLDTLFDEVVEGLDRPRVYLKLDTQGFDLEAFAGAGSRIDEVIGMQSEVSAVPIYEGMPRLTEQLSIYEAAGFELTGMFPVITDPETMRVIEFDAVMVRAGAMDGGPGLT